MIFFLFLAVKKRKKFVHCALIESNERVIWIIDGRDIPLLTCSLDIFANGILVCVRMLQK